MIVITPTNDDSLELFDRVLQLDDGQLTTARNPKRPWYANPQGVTP